jgi:hypothetical protein
MPKSALCTAYASDWPLRLWTIQECALATNPVVLCGSSKVDWEQFIMFYVDNYLDYPDGEANVCRWIYRFLGSNFLQQLELCTQMENDSYGPAKVLFLLHFCIMSQHGECSEPLDKVYALYGILGDYFSHLPKIDYTRDKGGLFADFTRLTIQSCEKFWPASDMHWRSEPASGVPSWAQDLTSTSIMVEQHLNSLRVVSIHDGNPSSSLDSKVSMQLVESTSPYAIELKGIAHERIRATTERWPKDGEDASKHTACLVSWINQVAVEQRRAQNDGEGMALALADVIAATEDLPNQEARKKQMLSVLKWIQSFPNTNSAGVDSLPAVGKWAEESKRNKNVSGILNNVRPSDCVLFLTETNCIGITAGYAEQGDTIALLAGSDRPVILRQDEAHWRCIGSSYVHGIMGGEAWPRDRPVEDLESFVLL